MSSDTEHYLDFLPNLLGLSEQELLSGGGIFAQPGGDLHFFWGEPEFSDSSDSQYPVLYVNDFHLTSKKPYVKFAKYRKILRSELQLPLSAQLQLQLDWSEPQLIDFAKIFTQIRSDFERGLQKIVPVVFAHSEHDVPLVHLLTSAILNQEDRWLYGFWSNGQGFLGVTPELLVQRNVTTISSMALAGTSKVEAFLPDAKNNREHQLVVDEIQRRLSMLGEVTVSATEEWSIGSIKHLRALLQCNAKNPITCSALVELLHPTPALGSLPFLANRSDQVRYDAEDRKHFGAPFGFIADADHETFVVSIRCVDWDGRRMRLGSGCGVIAESVLELEWQELQAKRQSVREIFNI